MSHNVWKQGRKNSVIKEASLITKGHDGHLKKKIKSGNSNVQ